MWQNPYTRLSSVNFQQSLSHNPLPEHPFYWLQPTLKSWTMVPVKSSRCQYYFEEHIIHILYRLTVWSGSLVQSFNPIFQKSDFWLYCLSSPFGQTEPETSARRVQSIHTRCIKSIQRLSLHKLFIFLSTFPSSIHIKHTTLPTLIPRFHKFREIQKSRVLLFTSRCFSSSVNSNVHRNYQHFMNSWVFRV